MAETKHPPLLLPPPLETPLLPWPLASQRIPLTAGTNESREAGRCQEGSEGLSRALGPAFPGSWMLRITAWAAAI